MAGYPPQQPPYPPAGYPPPGYAAPGYPPNQQPPPPSDSGSGGCCSPSCCLGCVVVILLVVAAFLGFSYWVYVSVANAAAQGVRNMAQDIVKDAPIPEKDKERVASKIEHLVNELTRVDKIVGRIQSGKFSEENLKKVVEKAMKSPIVQGLMVEVAKGKYLAESGLGEDEKKQAEKVWRRLVQGLVEGKIKPDGMDEALDKISSKNSEGDRTFREHLSDEDLRAFIEECQELVDDAGIPDNAPDVNLADEFDKLVDDILRDFE